LHEHGQLHRALDQRPPAGRRVDRLDLRDVFGDKGNTDLWVQQVKQVSPASQIVMLDFFQSYAP
jgi:hypothetical protein